MALTHLEFEEPIALLESQLALLREQSAESGIDTATEIKKLQKKINRQRKEVFNGLTPWQRTQLARHPNRPYTLDFIEHMTTDFIELHGDRLFADGVSIVGGFARLDGVSSHDNGKPEGTNHGRKNTEKFWNGPSRRVQKSLEADETGREIWRSDHHYARYAWRLPGVEAEERGQSEAIAKNLLEMSKLTVPVIGIVIGEGGSGGALALGVGNKIIMLEHSVYSVITPEGCAAILWNDQKKVAEAAEALKLTAQDLLGPWSYR